MQQDLQELPHSSPKGHSRTLRSPPKDPPRGSPRLPPPLIQKNIRKPKKAATQRAQNKSFKTQMAQHKFYEGHYENIKACVSQDLVHDTCWGQGGNKTPKNFPTAPPKITPGPPRGIPKITSEGHQDPTPKKETKNKKAKGQELKGPRTNFIKL